MLNAEVISKEDHGYVMSIGVENVKAFLNNKNIPENGNYKFKLHFIIYTHIFFCDKWI